jgi:hypothetical protein
MLRRGLSIHSFDSNLSLTTLADYQDKIDIDDYELSKLESGVFVLQHSDLPFEVELLLSGSHVKEYHCTCQRFSNEGFCEHSLSILFKVQNLKKQRKERHYSISNTSVSQKFQIQDILSAISFEELTAFVKDYASNNRDFALNLRAAFELRVANSHKDSTSGSLLVTILKHVDTQGKTWTKKKADRLSVFIDKYIRHINRLIAEKNYQLAFNLIDDLSRPILPICYRNIQNESLLKISNDIHKLIVTLYHSESLSPLIVDKLQDLLVEISLSHWYVPINNNHCVYLMCRNVNHDIMLHSIQEKLQLSGLGRESRSILITGWIFFRSKFNLQQTYPEDQWSLIQWNTMLHLISDFNEWKLCSPDIGWILNNYIPSSILPLAIQDLVKLVQDENQKYFVENIAHALLLQPDFVKDIVLHRSVAKEVFDQMVQSSKVVSDFKAAALFSNRYHLEVYSLEYFRNLNNYTGKVGLLYAIPNKAIQKELDNLLQDTVIFLQNYFGGENIDKVIYLLEILNEKGMKDESAQFALDLLNEIPDRSLLKQKMKQFFVGVKQNGSFRVQ